VRLVNFGENADTSLRGLLSRAFVGDPLRRSATNGAGSGRDVRFRLALVGPLAPPAGGMANQTLQLARLLRGEGVDVDIVQVNTAYRPAFVSRIRGVRAIVRLVPYIFALLRSTGRAQIVHVMANSGWAWHLFAAPAILVAGLRRRPVVVNYRGGEAPRFLARAARSVRWTLRWSRALVVPSPFLKHAFAAHRIESLIIANVIDISRFAARKEFDREHAPLIILTRNLEPVYDVPTALQAFALIRIHHPNARLAIAGSGPERAALEALAVALGVRGHVDFTGRLDPEQIAALCARADLMLNPARVDNMPNSVLEALAGGVPVVSTNVGGIPYMVEHERTALLVPAGDAQAMADAALRVLQDEPLRERLRREGRHAAEQYTWERIGPLWLGLYDALLPAS
jgi:glycosyltransferase involved in cell wall biosynthesis